MEDSAKPIGRLSRVPLRKVWPHEAYDFTTWLEKNTDVLTSATGIDFSNVEREHSTGNFSVDLIAEDANNSKIIIENQLGRSDHDHLGKVLTYLASTNANTAIWIVADPRPEHVAAVSWLNESSSGDFFLLKVEAVTIGNSEPAPLMTRIVGPSEETKTVSQKNREFSERYDLRIKWWSSLVARPSAKMHSHITPGRYSWIGLASGVKGIGYNYSVRQHDCKAEIYIDVGKGMDDINRAIFDEIESHKHKIESEFGGDLIWEALEAARACRISTKVEGGYKSDPEDWDEIQDSVVERMNSLANATKPIIKALKSVR